MDVQTVAAKLKQKPIINEILSTLHARLPRALVYHSAAHTEDVLNEAVFLAVRDGLGEHQVELLAIAAAFHDAGYLTTAVDNEPLGAQMAMEAMRRQGTFDETDITLIQNMILDTRVIESSFGGGQIASTDLSRYLLDADLCNFGRDDFFEKMSLVQQESGTPQQELYRRTLDLMENHRWFTKAAYRFRETKKQENMQRLRAVLGGAHQLVLSPASEQPVAQLTVQVGSDPSRQLTLMNGATIRIGRAKNNDIVLAHPNASRFHAVLSASPSGVLLSDLTSMNGTFVNDQRILTPVALKPGDTVRIADADVTVAFRDTRIDGTIETSTTIASSMVAVFVTVLVVDICNYTRMSQSLPPHDVARMLSSWFEQILSIVQRYGGTVDKFIGDGVMVLWHGHDKAACAHAAVEAGLAIISQTNTMSLSDAWPARDNFPWKCRAAVNSGEALMGSMGRDNFREFTVLGDTINVAFKLENFGSAHSEEFVIGETTANLLDGQFPIAEIDSLRLPESQSSHRVFAIRATPPPAV